MNIDDLFLDIKDIESFIAIISNKSELITGKIESEMTINKLIAFSESKNCIEKEYFWYDILDYLSISVIDSILFDYLFKNNLCLDKLAHFDLNNQHLKKLSVLYDEAFITLAIRYFKSDSYSNLDLIQLLVKCKYESVFEQLFLIEKNFTVKKMSIFYAISKNCYLSDEFKNYANKIYYANVLLFSKDEKMLTDAFEQKDSAYMLSLSKNLYTPKKILNELSNISGIKYASQIRNNSKETLKIIDSFMLY